MSMPFYDEEFTFTQPDGSQIKVRGTGDQYGATFKTLDGFTITRDTTSGFYHYAKLDKAMDALVSTGVRVGSQDPEKLGLEKVAQPSAEAMRAVATPSTDFSSSPMRWQVRRAQRRAAADPADATMSAPPQRPTVGNFVGLCLLIHFRDQPAPTITQQQVEAYCNKRGYGEFGNNGSVCDYFNDVSDGKLNYTNNVVPYYTTKHPREYYTNKSVTYGLRAQELIREALAHHLANGIKFSGLTADNDGYVYAVNVFYAGTRVNGWREGLWPHSGHLSSKVEVAAGKFGFDYQITDIGEELTLGTFCHEN
jgi:hypothetical protein